VIFETGSVIILPFISCKRFWNGFIAVVTGEAFCVIIQSFYFDKISIEFCPTGGACFSILGPCQRDRGEDEYHAYFRVGSLKLWTGTSGSGTVNVDVSTIVGVKEIALGVEVLEDYIGGSVADGNTWFDNLVKTPDIPTLSEWGLIVLFLLLVVVGFIFIRQRRGATV
jgi:hypothetical protein